MSDPLPSQVSFVGPISTSQGACTRAGDTIHCDFDDIPFGETRPLEPNPPAPLGGKKS